MLRLAPSHPPLWRSPSSLQLGVDPAVRLEEVTVWQETLLDALHDGIPDAMLLPLARTAGAPVDGAAEFVERISVALMPGASPLAPIRVELPAELGIAEEDALLGGLRASGHRVAQVTRWAPEDPDPSLPTVIVAHRLIDPRRAARLMAVDITHLGIELAGDRVTVGPLVVPGSTPCLACVHAHRRDRDPTWPLVAAQLLGRAAIPTDLALVWEASVLAGRMLRSPDAASASVSVSSASVRRRWRAHRPHDQCLCRSPERSAGPSRRDGSPGGTGTADEASARSPAPTSATAFARPA